MAAGGVVGVGGDVIVTNDDVWDGGVVGADDEGGVVAMRLVVSVCLTLLKRRRSSAPLRVVNVDA